jgi:hypothetical protein
MLTDRDEFNSRIYSNGDGSVLYTEKENFDNQKPNPRSAKVFFPTSRATSIRALVALWIPTTVILVFTRLPPRFASTMVQRAVYTIEIRLHILMEALSIRGPNLADLFVQETVVAILVILVIA